MNVIREIFSVLCFCLSCYFILDLFNSGFSWILVVAMISFYIVAYIIWPSRHNKKSKTDDYGFLDTLELIIEFPYNAITSLFRAIGSFFRRAEDIDIDMDIDIDI